MLPAAAPSCFQAIQGGRGRPHMHCIAAASVSTRSHGDSVVEAASTFLDTATPSDTHLVLPWHLISLIHNPLGQLQLVLASQLAHGLRFEAPVARQEGHKGPALELEESPCHQLPHSPAARRRQLLRGLMGIWIAGACFCWTPLRLQLCSCLPPARGRSVIPGESHRCSTQGMQHATPKVPLLTHLLDGIYGSARRGPLEHRYLHAS